MASSAIHGQHRAAIAQKCALATLVLLAVVLSVLLLERPELVSGVRAWLGATDPSETQKVLVEAALIIYFLRSIPALFVFLPRGLGSGEAIGVGVWVILIFSSFAILTSGQAPWPASGWIGGVLYVFGSVVHSTAEFQRYRWKRRPENKGRLFTTGLFRYSMHANYLGDSLWSIGLALLVGHWLAWWVPITMITLFVFVHIPTLDRHLAQRYGADFEDYRRRTARLVPFLY
ncbi:MAG: DUF1295 domain-containing protein [Spirochaetales bacterium]|nr:DUF1295 domain-containing protein [Leptospiraceae bacterium]MCP5481396.1 DUF1295 domain-containing protein [Spirochaetales bacterium]